MDDLISRREAVKAIRDAVLAWSSMPQWREDKIVDAVKHLPSAQQWIPWNSGRYPDESRWYIVTAYDGNTSRVTFAKYQTRLKRWELTGARAYWRVLAWCELPEPWKGEQDG